jgi:hypothetical protein
VDLLKHLWWWLLYRFYTQNSRWDDDDDEVRFVLNQQAQLDFYSASSLKQQSADKQVAPLGNSVLIPSQPVYDVSS